MAGRRLFDGLGGRFNFESRPVVMVRNANESLPARVVLGFGSFQQTLPRKFPEIAG